MNEVFIVDEHASDLCADLNAISKREKQAVRFHSLSSLEQMFRELGERMPDLILLHHHWPGLTVSQVLGRIIECAEDTRVIVFTGQSVDPSELIECARCGVADYWTKRGTLEPIVVFRQIIHYCASAEWTLRKLRMPSGSQRQLLQQAEKSLAEIEKLSRTREELEGKVRALESQESLAVWRAIGTAVKFAFNSGVLTGAFIAVHVYTNLPVWAALGFVGIIALFFLLLEGKLTEAFFKWRGGSARLRAK